MGYTRKSTDPLEILRQQNEAAVKAARESLRAGGTQPFQAVAKLQAAVADLQDTTEDLATVTAYLAGQQGYAAISGHHYWFNNPAVNYEVTWIEHDPSRDPVVAVTAPSTGMIRADLSAYLSAGVNAFAASGAQGVWGEVLLAVEVMSGSTQVLAPSLSRAVRTRAQVYGSNNANVAASSCAGTFVIDGLTPGQTYTIRTRHGSSAHVDTEPADSGCWQQYTVSNGTLSIILMGI